ncbi:hypothetical protein BCR37DRAFT_392756 [Protomyces lactucae-debilis]|uniref:S-adenosyl-L-methionine-dependent methyltransferase n=1 Tax=Protomyces lactucae-debilis TaxID=2754530 RepID=A0A1Y2FGK3_PROLT|nr:uncharacterized protein BCR37DRAFT_392756 [Protomyces lactucae-debilis]ORY82544.1 hypothetical protein BCR37DRAFT_392756 [Protomyces lactucae-debilis]
MLPTPNLSHLKEADYEHIYEPAEDSFLLLDALEADREVLETLPACPLLVEIGPGSGVATAFVQSQLLSPVGRSCLSIAVDINPLACRATLETCQRNARLYPGKNSCVQHTDVVRGSLLDALYCARGIDILLFNPPYVPTMQAEINTDGMHLASTWAGGQDGMSVTQQLLPRLQHVLSVSGVFYLVAVARNKPADLIRDAASIGCEACMILERRAGREKLCVLRYRRLR